MLHHRPVSDSGGGNSDAMALFRSVAKKHCRASGEDGNEPSRMLAGGRVAGAGRAVVRRCLGLLPQREPHLLLPQHPPCSGLR